MENETNIDLQNQSENIQLTNRDLPIESLKTKKSPINAILLSFLLIISGVAAFFGYKYYQLLKATQAPKQELIEENIIPTESPTPSQTLDKTLNWEKYINNNYKYEIKYPKGWEITDLVDGEQVEIYYQPDKTKAVGSILIESISSSLYKNSLNSIASPIENKIGETKAVCHTDGLSKTWCYLSNNGEYFSILTIKNGDKTYDDNLDQIISTLKFGSNNDIVFMDKNDPRKVANDYLTAYVNKDWVKAKEICPSLDEKIAEGYGFTKFEVTGSIPDENGNYYVYVKFTNEEGEIFDKAPHSNNPLQILMSKDEKGVWKVLTWYFYE